MAKTTKGVQATNLATMKQVHPVEGQSREHCPQSDPPRWTELEATEAFSALKPALKEAAGWLKK